MKTEIKPAREPRLTKAAILNHEGLFPGYKSTLKVTDPELIEIFDNFAFDEVLNYGNLDTKTRLMMILSSTIASQAVFEYRVMLGAALNVGVTPIEAKEILYQSVPYVGMAKVIDFVHITNEVLTQHGVKLPLEARSTTSPKNRFEKGLELQKVLFGETIDRMYKESPENQLHIQKFLSDNCFGDFYTRKGLDVKKRRTDHLLHDFVVGRMRVTTERTHRWQSNGWQQQSHIAECHYPVVAVCWLSPDTECPSLPERSDA